MTHYCACIIAVLNAPTKRFENIRTHWDICCYPGVSGRNYVLLAIALSIGHTCFIHQFIMVFNVKTFFSYNYPCINASAPCHVIFTRSRPVTHTALTHACTPPTGNTARRQVLPPNSILRRYHRDVENNILSC